MTLMCMRRIKYDATPMSYGYWNSIAKLSPDYFAIPYRGVGYDGFVSTVRTNDITNNLSGINEWEFKPAITFYGGNLITVSGTVRAIVYAMGGPYSSRLCTLDISDVGVVAGPLIDDVQLELAGFDWPEILHRSGTMYMLLAADPSYAGRLQTRTITAAGDIAAGHTDRWQVDPDNISGLGNLLQVSGDVHAFLYRNAVTDVTRLCTVRVTAAGFITKSFVHTMTLETGPFTHYHRLRHVAGTTYAIVYEIYADKVVKLHTVDIQNDGSISHIASEVYSYPTILEVSRPDFIKYDTGQFMIVNSVRLDITCKIIEIAANGIIGSVLETTTATGVRGRYPSVVNRTGKEFVIAHGDGNYGQVSYWGVAPVATTQAVDNILPTSAMGHGTIVGIGEPNAIAHGFVWNTTGSPDYWDNRTDLGAVLATGAFSDTLPGLTPVTTYYVRAYAQMGDPNFGIAYGPEVSFTTPVALATVTTDAETGLGQLIATFNGTLDDDGAEACECGFEWGRDITYGLTTQTESKLTGETFLQQILGLFPSIEYHYRSFATNSAGTVYGADRPFRAKPGLGKAYALSRSEL